MDDLAHLVAVAGVDHTILGSDLGLTQAPRPVDGYRMIVDQMLDHQISRADIKKMTSTNAAKLLG
ncbi:membrane dipeptidase, partial [Stenotrophomonas sp. AS012628]|uniref:membrane dipeptidase n=1 Tax=Stenotrophomonas sp. AS012628 TaxID=2597656 RepID=UPI001785B7DB